jgi:uncharacterized protein (DUF1800 family)
MNLALTPEEAWQPLPATEWDEAAAGHLLRRIGWSAQPPEVARALEDGLARTLQRQFPATPPALPTPPSVVALEEDTPEFAEQIRAAAPAERRVLNQQARERSRNALLDLTVHWLQHARRPEYAVGEKWTLFLGNIYVVAAQKVPNTALLYRHQDLLRRNSAGCAPELTKAVLRSPAMISYLDLQQNRTGAPNENFARELMELFTLGIGHYTENDVKEAARALTGYVQRFGEYRFAPRLHDHGSKTIFGRTGNFDGDGVIDLIYTQKAVGTHLPERLTRFYLTDDPLPDGFLAALGEWWRGTGFNLRQLAQRYFSSRLFFAPQFRGAFIKSPVQLFLGLVQDFSLDVAPLPRRLEPAFRQMGQVPYNPPNVRGWVGGREWISSATLEARRVLTRSLFQPFDESRLNADEQRAVESARSGGEAAFTVSDDALRPYAALNPDEAAGRLLQRLLPLPATAAYRQAVSAALAGEGPAASALARVRNATVAVLETPESQLC